MIPINLFSVNLGLFVTSDPVYLTERKQSYILFSCFFLNRIPYRLYYKEYAKNLTK